MDTFGPIADNAGGIVEMSQAPDEVRHRMDKLDAAGNTTKALTKGYAIGSASLAVFLLFNAYMADIAKLTGKAFDVVNLANVNVFVGALLGAMLVFLFASLAIRAVSKTAQSVIEAGPHPVQGPRHHGRNQETRLCSASSISRPRVH